MKKVNKTIEVNHFSLLTKASWISDSTTVNRYMRIKLKFLVLFLVLIGFSSIPIQANSSSIIQPIIRFDRFQNEGAPEPNNPDPTRSGRPAFFYSYLGQSPDDETFKDTYRETLQDRGNWISFETQNVDLFSLKLSLVYDHLVYVIQNNKIIGYNLMEPVMIINDLNKPNSIIAQIQSLPERQEPLEPNFSLPKGFTIKVYEIKHDQYIERYIIGTIKPVSGEMNFVLVDAFYPKWLDGEMTRNNVAFLKRFN